MLDAADAIDSPHLDTGSVVTGLIFSTVTTITATIVIHHSRGDEGAMTFVACYLLELSLSVDNMFAFYLLFKYFRTPSALQPAALSWGIAGAIVLRALALLVGLAAISAVKPLLLVFAGLLTYSAIGMLRSVGSEAGDDEDLGDKQIVQCVRACIPVTPDYHGDHLFVRHHGSFRATPLFLVLVCIELSDIVFALDSVPAVLGMSSDTLIVYLAVMCAVLSLRSLYTLTVLLIERFAYLPIAVALVLLFISAKIAADLLLGLSLPTGVSLIAVGSILCSGVVLSSCATGGGWNGGKVGGASKAYRPIGEEVHVQPGRTQ